MAFNYQSSSSLKALMCFIRFYCSRQWRSKATTIDEVELFRAVLDSFKYLHSDCVVEEFHQKSMVTFKPCGPYKLSPKFLKGKKRYAACELSDIYLISYDSSTQNLKHTFIQAKYDAKRSLNDVITKGSSAELHQWDLLRRRPVLLTGSFKKISIPPNILKKATYKSVGSYIFFSKEHDFCFFDASRLKPLSRKPANKALVKYRTKSLPETFRGTDVERHFSAYSLEFYQHVFDFKIGSPIKDANDKKLLKQILGFVKTNQQNADTLINEILSGPLSDVSLGEDGPTTDIGLPVNAIIIVRAQSRIIEG